MNSEYISYIVPIIVGVIILLQIFFFVKNVLRMKEYKQIFGEESSWAIDHNTDTGFVSGIRGVGNNVFSSIKDSINKYLGNNSGSVIDFHLLKDAVDRHCDVVENDINTLTPVPLYCGLAGTMAGVIIGLYSLLSNDSIEALLTPGSETYEAAAIGVNDLLKGVAWAMLASICGIFFTTLGSILFKRYKLKGEFGKNTFLAWLQAKLLPELPSDTSEALSKLVKNLNKFNSTFAGNTSDLRDALKGVNDSYRIQADIIKTVHDMDVMKMAKANVKVLQELNLCTDKIALFNQYLNDIHGYTDAIHTFTSQFEVEANRLHVLEEIQQFFTRHKEEIVKDSADIDVALSQALNQLRESTGNNISELNKIFVQQAEEFKRILHEEKDSFEKINEEIGNKFNNQISQLPMLESKLSEISLIPEKIDSLIERIEKSNSMLYKSIAMTLGENKKTISDKIKEIPILINTSKSSTQTNGNNRIIVISVILIALACITNTVHNIFNTNNTEDRIDEAIIEQPIIEQPIINNDSIVKIEKRDSIINGNNIVDTNN